MTKTTGYTPSRGWMATVGFVAIAALAACGSSGTAGRAPQTSPAVAPPVSAPRVTEPAQIETLEATSRNGGIDIEVTADRSLVWTTYRDVEGNLVVELPNSTPQDDVANLSRPDGLLRSVDVERLEDAERPLTRLVIRTREDTEHSLTTEGDLLRLALLPTGYVASNEAPPAPAPPAVAYEPLPETIATEPAAPSEAEAMPMPAHFGTPDAPQAGPKASGVLASRLTGVEVLRGADATVIHVVGDGEFEYTTFRLENPERFVLDLTGVVNTSLRSTVPIGDDVVDQVRLGQFKPSPDPVSRVVFDLSHFVAPMIERSGEGLTITFGGTEPPPPQTTLAQEVAADELPDEPEAPAEEAMPTVLAETTEPPPFEPADEPAIESQDLGVSEAPVQVAEAPPAAPMYEPEPPMVAEVREPEPPRVAAPPPVMPRQESPVAQDVALYEAQQVPPSAEPAAAETQVIPPSFESLVVSSQQRTYIGPPITMSLRNADLVETLRSFSRISDLNFVIQPGVQGTVTVELNGVPWDQALEQILKINNLGMDIDGTIVRIAPLSQLQAEAEARRRLAEERKRTVPLTTVMHSLSYANANEVSQLLLARSTVGDRGRSTILSSRGSVQVDRRTNTLIIRELPEVIDTVLAVVRNLDTPEPQVRIEARIVEATKNFTRSLGIRWGFTGEASQALGNTTGLEFPNNLTTDGGVNLLTGGANGFLNLSMGNILDSFTLDTSLIAAEAEGLVNVVSAPSVMTLNNERATIQSGIQIPVQTVANNTVTVQYINATLQLAVLPQITAEGTILMEIDVAKKEPQTALVVAGAANAPIATREASTRVIVRDGGTAVIGGIYEVTNNQSQDRVPGLANVPILGHLFRNRARENTNQELLIFVTPRIIQL